jgi:DNA-binding transcriptional MerR regulator
MADKLIDSTEAAELLGGVHLSTLTRWEQTGRLAVAQRAGRGPRAVRLFRLRDVLALQHVLATEATAKAAAKASA